MTDSVPTCTLLGVGVCAGFTHLFGPLDGPLAISFPHRTAPAKLLVLAEESPDAQPAGLRHCAATGARTPLELVGLVLAIALMVLPSTGCPTVDLGEEPVAPGSCRPDPAYFETVIWPEFIEGSAAPGASCVANSGCHDANNNGRSSLRFQTATPINFSVNYDIISRFLNCSTPSASTALTKPQAGVATHGGGDLFAGDSASVQTFLMWFDL